MGRQLPNGETFKPEEGGNEMSVVLLAQGRVVNRIRVPNGPTVDTHDLAKGEIVVARQSAREVSTLNHRTDEMVSNMMRIRTYFFLCAFDRASMSDP